MTRHDFTKMVLPFTALSYKNILGANSRVRVGFIGLGTMGMANMETCLRTAKTEISGVCDVYNLHLEKGRQKAKNNSSRLLKTADFRTLLDDKNTDAVCISTPDHWHALMTIMAFQAGKHVYCEKPIAHRVSEIPLMMAAQQKYRKVFTSGQWQRSGNQFIEAINQISTLGKLTKVETWFKHKMWNLDRVEDSDPPTGLNWDMWLGPAPRRPFNSNRFLFNWRWFWDYANGWLGDWGAHMVDIAELGLFSQALWITNPYSVSIVEAAAANCTDDVKETPTFFGISYDFGNNLPPVLFNYDGCSEKTDGREWGIKWTGENGSVFVDRKICESRDNDGRIIKKTLADGKAHTKHWQNFIHGIANNNPATNASLAKVGMTNLDCLLAAAAYRHLRATGLNKIIWDSREMQSATASARSFSSFCPKLLPLNLLLHTRPLLPNYP